MLSKAFQLPYSPWLVAVCWVIKLCRGVLTQHLQGPGYNLQYTHRAIAQGASGPDRLKKWLGRTSRQNRQPGRLADRTSSFSHSGAHSHLEITSMLDSDVDLVCELQECSSCRPSTHRETESNTI